MTTITKHPTAAVRVADKDADEQVWLDARAGGVTATDVRKIAQGSASTRRRILDDKLNGSTFRGNRHTARGNRREPILADWAHRKFGTEPSSWLYAHPENRRYLATPDGLGTVLQAHGGGLAGLEVKSHDNGFQVPADIVPAEHYDQCQWGMFVTGARRWLYVWEVMDADGQPPLEPGWVWIDRDDTRIQQLREAADAFLAWRDAGAPLIDEGIAADMDAAISRHVKARSVKDAAAAMEKKAEQRIRELIAADEAAAAKGTKQSGSDGQVSYTVTRTETTELDWEAWEADAPTDVATHRQLKEALAEAEKEALDLYPKVSVRQSTRLVVRAHEKEKSA